MRIFITIFFALLLSGCRPSGVVNFSAISPVADSSEVIDVTEAILHPEKTKESTFDSIRLIFLETSEPSILSAIVNVVVVNNRIIIFDRYKNGSVAIFDTAGKFLKRLPFGNGPEEIGQADKIFCTDEFLFVYDIGSKKISKFSLDGRFVSNLHIRLKFEDFAIVNDDLFLFFSKGLNSLGSFLLMKYDSIPDNCHLWNLCPAKFYCSQTSIFQYCKEGMYITMPWEENVYCYKDSAVFKKYSFLNKNSDVDFSQYRGVDDMLRRLPDGVFVRTGIFMESADFQYSEYATYRFLLKEVFRDKRTGHVWTNNFTKNSLLNFFSIGNVADYESNTFLGVIMPEIFFLYEDIPDWRWDGSNPGNLVSEADMEKLRSVKPDDNPIIVLFKLKSDL